MNRYLACLVLGLLATAVIAGSAPPTIIPWQDWPTVRAPAEPPRTDTVTPRVVWRLDCSEDADLLVGRLTAAAPGPEGRVLLVDSQLTSVLIVGADGVVEGTRGQQGEGPGEVGGIYRTLALDDGRVGFIDGAPFPTFVIGCRGEIVFNDPAGDPAGVWLLEDNPANAPLVAPRDLRHAGGHVLVTVNRVVVDMPQMHNCRELILLREPDGARTLVAATVYTASIRDMDIDELSFFEPWAGGSSDVNAAGRIAVACERDRWRVAIFHTDVAGIVVERPLAPRKRTQAAIDAAYAELGGGGPGEVDVLDTEPLIGRIRWRPDGRLWVEPFGVVPAPGAFACFDELEPDGTLVRRVQLVLPGDPAYDQICLLEDGRFVLLRGFKRVDDEEGAGDRATEAVLLGL